ncbi:MAG: protein BatD [Bacteroidales bacterium]|nr:protein BatD [Bacteroidales bacterium]
MKKIVNIIIGLISFNFLLFSQDVSFTVSAPKVVSVGEQFKLVYNVNSKISKFQPPEINDFNILMGPSSSSSSSVQIINGRMSQNINISYTYVLNASKTGKFTVGPASVIVDNKTYSTDAIEIEVIGDNSQAAAQNNNKTNQTETQDISSSENKNLFVRVLVDRHSLYQGEYLVATIKIYTRMSLAGFDKMKFPSFDGFWSQEIFNPNQISLERENVNGIIYDVGILKKTLLYPQRSGEIIIDPMEVDCVVRQKASRTRSSSIFDQFFEDPFAYTNKKYSIKSPRIKVNVKPLPGNKPASYTGGVGNYTINATVDKTELDANDAITYKFKVSGKGNLKLIDKPALSFPPDFEVFEPKVSEKIDHGANGSSGSKTFEYIIIPRHAGDFKIPSVDFSYFNSETKTYKTLSTDEIDIRVNKGADEPQSTVMSGFSKEDIQVLGNDIAFIKTDNIKLTLIGKAFYKSLWFYLSYLVSLGLFIAIILSKRKKIKESDNISLLKNKRANKLARKRLRLAGKYLKENNSDRFYEAVLKGVWGYLSDKLNIPVADLSRDSAFSALSRHAIEDSDLDRLSKLIDNCEYAQYAPKSDSSQMHQFYNEAVEIIGLLSQKIK